MANYFESEDLKKFGNIGRVNKELADKFFEYYNATMKAGALSEREKALIALAVAHAQKVPLLYRRIHEYLPRKRRR
jgi:alkylhydroperoxidase/carboxymuconolactone decarboxylase family protein YurZ